LEASPLPPSFNRENPAVKVGNSPRRFPECLAVFSGNFA